MRSPRWIVLVALAVLLVMPGCALVNTLVEYPTPTPRPQRALRPTFTPTAVSDAPAEAVVQAPEATPEPPTPEPPAAQVEQPTAPPPPTEVPPTPTATPTPFVVVSNDIARVRSGPGVDYPQLGELAQGASLALTARNEAGDWWQVCCVDDQPVWISADLAALQGSAEGVAVAANVPPPPTPTPSPTPQPEVVVVNPRVNVRSQPASDAPVLGQVLEGARLQIVGRDQVGDWWQVCCFEGSTAWVASEVVRAEGPLELVALSPDLPTATPEAAAAAATPEPATPAAEADFTQSSETFPFNQDYFRVAVRVQNAAGEPLTGYYLRTLNETTGQQWISNPSGDQWDVTAPNPDFADFREANLFFDTRGKAPLADNAFAVWLVDGRGRQVSPIVRLAQTDDEFQWLYVVFSGQ